MKVLAILFVFLLVSSSVLSQSETRTPEWTIVTQLNGDRIELKCIDGCSWKLNSVTCGHLEQCRFTLDEGGVRGYAEPFDYEAELEKGRKEYEEQRRQLLEELADSAD